MTASSDDRHEEKPAYVETNDGGAAALLGYLYQLLGSAAISVVSADAADGHVPSESFVFEVEKLGQDASRISSKRVELIQFKYSQAQSAVPPGELAEILTRFDASQRSIDPTKTVQWILKTNRDWSVNSQALLDGKEPPNPLQINPENRRTIERFAGRDFRREHLTIEQAEDDLRKRAKRLGVDAGTLALGRVFHYLFQAATKPPGLRRIDLQEIDDALAGYAGARLLDAVECTALMRAQLTHLAEDQDGVSINDAIPRPEIARVLHSPESALVLIIGSGGAGKTLSVLKALHDSLARRELMVGALMPPPSRGSQSLPELVASWRADAGAPMASVGASLERIVSANDRLLRPVFVLCLDGIDEVRWQERKDAEALVLHFHHLHQRSIASDALLILTCRTRAQFDKLVRSLGTGGEPRRQVEEVLLDDFSPEEFRTVWQRWFPTEDVPEVNPPWGSLATLGSQPMPPNFADAARALRHPVLLGCVRKWTEDARAQLLAGDPRRWRDLLKRYLEWFAAKVEKRRKCDGEIVEWIVRSAVAAAKASSFGARFVLKDHWIAPAEAATGQSRVLLEDVFEDGLTAGLLVLDESSFDDQRFDQSRILRPMPDATPWRWRFPFIWQHLSW